LNARTSQLSASRTRPAVSIKTQPSDWVVDELLGFTPSGEGEHALFRVRKVGLNTLDVARELARELNLPGHAVGYCGRKDKHAETTQWFSVPHPNDQWPLKLAGVEVLEFARHSHKLRIGSHMANQFRITLRNVEQINDQVLEGLPDVYPNGFGPQRCSPDNVSRALEWLPERRRRRVSKKQQGWHLSVLRSMLFNCVLEARQAHGNYATAIEGDDLIAQLNDKIPVSGAPPSMPTGPLWGRGRTSTQGEALLIEQAALAPYQQVCEDLEYAGVVQARRAFGVKPSALQVGPQDQLETGQLLLNFILPPGAYATSLLEHHFTVTDMSTPNE